MIGGALLLGGELGAAFGPGLVCPAGAGEILVWATDDGQKLAPNPTAPYPTANHVWTAADTTIRLVGARDEWVACQLVVRSIQPMTGVDVAASDLTWGAYRIPADNISLYRELDKFLSPVRPPNWPGTTGAGKYFDALIPFRDPYASQVGDVGAPFNVPDPYGTKPGVWVDIHVPPAIPAGTYRGTLTVTATGAVPVKIHLEVDVWDFTLSRKTDLMSLVGFYIDRLEEAEEVSIPDGELDEESWSILREYELMAREHRFTLGHRHMVPYAEFDSLSGLLTSIDWENYDTYLGQVIEGTSFFPDGEPPNVWMLPIRPLWLLPYGGSVESTMVSTYVDSVVSHFQAKGWPLDHSFAWIYDEPGKGGLLPSEVAEIHAYYQTVQATSPLVNFMVTEAMEWGDLLGAVDWWVTKGDKYYPTELQARQALGEKAFFYQSNTEPSLGPETINTYGLAWRTWPWIAWKYHVDGVLYWAGNYWQTTAPYDTADGQPESYNNGQGTFFYPGRKLDTQGLPDIAGPVSSVRMKAFRRGMQDYAYLEMLRDRGQEGLANSVVNSTILSALCDCPTCYSPTGSHRGGTSHYIGPMDDPRADSSGTRMWSKDPAVWYAARQTLGQALAALGEDSLTIWLLAPTGGERWGVGTSQSVTWQTSGGGAPISVDIFLSPDGGATLTETLATGEPDDGEFPWDVAGPVGDTLWCVVRACDGVTCAWDTSLTYFLRTDSLPPATTVMEPDGGEIWERSTAETVRWVATDNDEVISVDLFLSLDGGASFPVTIAQGEANDGVYVWFVPDTLSTSDRARVRVAAYDPSGSMGTDESDGVFSVEEKFTVSLLAPNGGELWDVGTSQEITWQTTGGGDSVLIDLFLSPDAGATLADTLAQSLPNAGLYPWQVARPPGDTLWVVVRACRGIECVLDLSDASWRRVDTLAPVVVVESPDGGETWQVTAAETVRWAATDNDTVASVDILLSLDNGATYPEVIAQGETHDGEIVWTLPPGLSPSDSARVRVVARDATGNPGADDSDAGFTIRPAPEVLTLEVGLLQNPVLTSYLDLFVVASQEISDTSLSVVVAGEPLAMEPTDPARHVYRGSYRLPAAGNLTISACARGMDSVRVCTDRVAVVELIRAHEGGRVRSADGALEIRVSPGSFSSDTHVLVAAEKVCASLWSGDRTPLALYAVGPAGSPANQPLEMRVSYAGRKLGGAPPERLGLLCRKGDSGDSWEPIRSFVDLGRQEIVALADRIATVALVKSETEILSEVLPSTVVLDANRPNPFHPSTTMGIHLPERCFVRLSVYDAAGRRIRHLVQGTQGPGTVEAVWDGRDDAGESVSSGIYFCRLEAGRDTRSRKMVLLR